MNDRFRFERQSDAVEPDAGAEYEEMRGGGLHHESYLKGEAALEWLSQRGVDFAALSGHAAVGGISVNIAPVNGVEGGKALLMTSARRTAFLIEGLPWVDGSFAANLPDGSADALFLMINGKVLTRTIYIGEKESAEAPARVSLLRAVGLTVVSWTTPGRGVVRQVQHYTCINKIRSASEAGADAVPLSSVMRDRMPHSLAVQEGEVHRKYVLTILRLRADAAECLERAAGIHKSRKRTRRKPKAAA